MGKAAKEQLNRALNEHLNTIHETLQVLNQTPSSSLERVGWKEVIQMGEQLYKQATMVGMLWTGETPEVKALEENMASYFNMLQGLLLLSHSSTVGAGPTLCSCIHASIKQVVDSSFLLMKESVSSYGSNNKKQKLSIPQLVGTVWEACSALKKTPPTNITAIGRAMTQLAVSMKDVLREMNELKPASSEVADEFSVQDSPEGESKSDDSDDSFGGDLGNDLSPEEMKIAHLTTDVVSETLVVIKELIRSITSLLKQESSVDNATFVASLERLLKLSQEIGLQVDELGASLYPPQEISALRAATKKISSTIDETQVELEKLKGCSEDFVKACTGLRSSLKRLEDELDHSDATDPMSRMENLVIE
ncbi:uncharacterized protein LOC107784470 isoform X1 [Nicotiana tabacum]|uniref:Uncharacterized protein LOC107784470 isoform X1 n=1 Tax=Nicotiana tabacum TaxID=4097 RepID=A0A1S3Z9J8_TOBAC|nr:uncharacterized protein LOC104107835 isoform X1 [Nicotiana tomentosiformis]XP_016461091.1 PREDICTED: uncharacterized protein LOC107784470 isoform X1 [Nicotiana tabacum]